MSNHSSFDWDPRDPVLLNNQRHAYDEMRERCPVAHSEFLGWSIFRYADVVDILENPETFSSASRHRAIPDGLDAPEHTAFRKMLEPYFTPEAMDRFAPVCREVATEQVRTLLTRKESDVVVRFAEPFAMKSLCHFVGWDPGSWERLLGWTHGNQQAAFWRDRTAGAALARAFSDFVIADLEKHRANPEAPPDSIPAQLMATKVGGEPLSDEDIVGILRTWTAGYGSVAGALGIMVLHLAEDQELQTTLRGHPDRIPAVVDEILRLDGPLVSNRRTAVRDVELDGSHITVGDNLTLMWIAANRDPRAFESAEEFRPDRDSASHLAFGHGPHYCLGAALAQLELRIGLEELLAGTTSFERDHSRPVHRISYPSNGLDTLPIRFD